MNTIARKLMFMLLIATAFSFTSVFINNVAAGKSTIVEVPVNVAEPINDLYIDVNVDKNKIDVKFENGIINNIHTTLIPSKRIKKVYVKDTIIKTDTLFIPVLTDDLNGFYCMNNNDSVKYYVQLSCKK